MPVDEYLDAAVIEGIHLPGGHNAARVLLSVTLPAGYISSSEPYLPQYKKSHRILAAVKEPLPGNDALYGFQAAPGQPWPPSKPAPKLLKSLACWQCAISLPTGRFYSYGAASAWEESTKCLKVEMQQLPTEQKAAAALAWLWLDAYIRAASKKPN